MTYIRTLPNRDMLPVTCVAISETLSDVATVHEPVAGGRDGDRTGDWAGDDGDAHEYERGAAGTHRALLRVHTVNGKFVGVARVAHAVTCAGYSAAPEGVSVNCVAVGLASGGVRLFSSWDLRPLAFLPPPDRPQPVLRYPRPILSMAFL